jgi:hypothetical protein
VVIEKAPRLDQKSRDDKFSGKLKDGTCHG